MADNNTCFPCPHRDLYKKGGSLVSYCKKTEQKIPNPEKKPSNCPLKK